MNPDIQEEKKKSSKHKYFSKEIKRTQRIMQVIYYKAVKEKLGSGRPLVLYSIMLEITKEFCT